MKTPKKFIAKAIKKEGILKKKALSMGLVKNADENLSETDLEKIEKLGGVWAKRVNLARTLKGFHKQGGGANSFYSSLSAHSKRAFQKTKELVKEASEKTKEGYNKAKKYAEDKIHDQKKKIALEVIDDTKENVSGNKYKIILAGAEELISEAYKTGGDTKNKVEKVMQEYKTGTLKSGSGHKVTERKQAIAIALSEAGLSRKWSGGETYKDGGDTPKKIDISTTKKIKNRYGKYVVGLITKDYIYFINPEEGDDNSNTIMYNKEGDLLSDNYFASDDLFGKLTEIANKREEYEYIRPSIKKYLKEYEDTERMKIGGGTEEKYEFYNGDVVWDRGNKSYGVILNNFYNANDGSGGEIRLDSDGMQSIFKYDKDSKITGYNLVPYGSKEDKGGGDLSKLKAGAQKLIDSNKDYSTERYKGYSLIYCRLLSGEFDTMKTGGEVGELEKELHKLQRELNSSRLQTYIEGDKSEEEKARKKEREMKLSRFNEVLRLLREKDKKSSVGAITSGKGTDNAKYAIGEKVLYVPKLSGFDNSKPLTVENVTFKKGDDLTKKGNQYTFKNSNMAAHEDDLTTYENLLLGIGTKINIPEFGGDKNVKMELVEVSPLSKKDMEEGLGARSYHFKGSKNRSQWYPEEKLRQRLNENSIEIVKRMDSGGDSETNDNVITEEPNNVTVPVGEPNIEPVGSDTTATNPIDDSSNISKLKSFADSDEKLAQEKDQIYTMATDMSWDADRLQTQFKRIFSYMAETAYNKQNPDAPIELTENERKQFAELYSHASEANTDVATEPYNERAKTHLEQVHDSIEKAENATIATQAAIQEVEKHVGEAKDEIEDKDKEGSFKDAGATPKPKYDNGETVYLIGSEYKEEPFALYVDNSLFSRSTGEHEYKLKAYDTGIEYTMVESKLQKKNPIVESGIKALEHIIDGLKKAIGSSKTKASSKENMKKKLKKVEDQLDDLINPKPKKGKYYVDIDIKYRRKMIPEIKKAKLKISTVSLGDKTRILMDTDMKQKQVFNIYNRIRQKENDTPINIQSITGTLKKIGRKHALKMK